MCTIGQLVINTSLSAQRALQEQPLIYTFLSNHCSQQLTKDALLSITINMNDHSSVLRKWHVHQSFLFTFSIFNTKLVNYFSKQVANKVDMSPLHIIQHTLTPTTDWPAMTVLMHSYSRDMADVLKHTTAMIYADAKATFPLQHRYLLQAWFPVWFSRSKPGCTWQPALTSPAAHHLHISFLLPSSAAVSF